MLIGRMRNLLVPDSADACLPTQQAAITPAQQFSANCRRIVEIGFRGQCDYFVWKNHDAFESAFADLLRDLRAQA